MRQKRITILAATTIFLSAFLLFWLEPLIARRLLPRFGGSAAVWSTCLVFYQLALLIGYIYARVIATRLRPRLHIVLLGASLLLLPIGPAAQWRQTSTAHPALLIFELLAASIGLAFVTLSATSPLIQSWAAARDGREPYPLFAISNFASLAALLAYPAVIEPLFGIDQQRLLWSVLYALFAVMCGAAAWRGRNSVSAAPTTPLSRMRWQWFALAACGSMLLLAITNHIDENVAAVPLLWVLPLAAYLLSFVFTFGARSFYRPGLALRLVAFTLGILGYATYNINTRLPLPLTLAIFVVGLFVCCFFFHGELNRLRPPAEQLTVFYLLIAAGGAFGALAIGIVAPHVFSGVYELPVTLFGAAILGFALAWPARNRASRLLWLGVAGCMALVVYANVQAYREGALSLRRSFYGSLRVVQTPHAGPEQQRILYHGTIEHGSQFLQPPRRERPTTYYGPDSGAGILLRECFAGPKRVAIVGLGAGTLAAYGQTGDDFTFYEINPQVVDIARSLFFYLRESHAHIRTKVGDGRLLLASEQGSRFDVILLDAFSGDAIPVHLLTSEAFDVYRQHLHANGALAFHISNDYLDLAPVLEQLAEHAGFSAILTHNHSGDDDAILPSDWMIVTRNESILHNPSLRAHEKSINIRSTRLWTDDYSDVLSIFKTPKVR